ncbi:glycoside hydrolase superfamily [Obelidium mucronatum]|nr:glycoside hydrolase superfamily [Obelidium mucronatum]
MRIINLSKASLWTLSEWGSEDPLIPLNAPIPAASFPTDVFTDLHAAGVIPDPLTNTTTNTLDVEERLWKYECRFDINDHQIMNTVNKVFVLACDGLDSVATVFLNGHLVASSQNMYVPLRVVLDQRWLSQEGQSNPRTTPNNLRTCMARVFVPMEIPSRMCGLEVFEARFAMVHCLVSVHESLKSATVKVIAEIEASLLLELAGMSCVVSVHTPAGKTLFIKSLLLQNNASSSVFQIMLEEHVIRGQPLYKVTCTLLHSSKPTPLHTHTHKFGLRRLELIETPLPPSPKTPHPQTSFYFSRPAATWIPSSSFLSSLTDPHVYRKWLTLAVQGNQNMIRVWGGGVYENDAFYEICDELGILVWQDFMFACAAYPAHPEFVDSVEKEVDAVVKRLRRFACVAIYTGNNEDYAFAEENPQLGYDPTSDVGRTPNFPLVLLYERVIPRIIESLSPLTAYKPGSPYTSGGKLSGNTDSGDCHQWNVWHGHKNRTRIMESLLVVSYPSLECKASQSWKPVKSFSVQEVGDMDALSECVEQRNKATGFAKRIGGYLVENLRFRGTRSYKPEALSTAYRQWRQLVAQLVWQLNDCWPCVSWSIVDHHLRPKPSYFAIKRQLAPVTIGIERKPPQVGNDSIIGDVWVVNTTNQELKDCRVVVTGFDYVSGKVLKEVVVTGVDVMGSFHLEVQSDLVASSAIVIGAKLYYVKDGTIMLCETE